MSRFSITTLRAAWWADRAAARVRRQLISDGLTGVGSVSLPPSLRSEAGRAVEAVLRRRKRSCLERALVLQAWHAAAGRRRDVMIGVARSEPIFRAHAWLDGDPGVRESDYEVLRRQPPVEAAASGSGLTRWRKSSAPSREARQIGCGRARSGPARRQCATVWAPWPKRPERLAAVERPDAERVEEPIGNGLQGEGNRTRPPEPCAQERRAPDAVPPAEDS